MRYYVVADVHAYFEEMATALKSAGFFDDKSPNKLIICGDILDRGGKPNELCTYLESLLKEDRLILIRGNHEDLLDDLLDNIDKYLYPTIYNTHHYYNGTWDTLLKMTRSRESEVYMYTKRVVNKMRETTFYKKLLSSAVDYFETENYIFVHGYIPCFFDGRPNNATSFKYNPDWRNASKIDWQGARWLNGMQVHNFGIKEEGKTIVCGHFRASYGHCEIEGKTVEKGFEKDNTPYYSDGIISIDANTPQSGFVNCIVIDD